MKREIFVSYDKQRNGLMFKSSSGEVLPYTYEFKQYNLVYHTDRIGDDCIDAKTLKITDLSKLLYKMQYISEEAPYSFHQLWLITHNHINYIVNPRVSMYREKVALEVYDTEGELVYRTSLLGYYLSGNASWNYVFTLDIEACNYIKCIINLYTFPHKDCYTLGDLLDLNCISYLDLNSEYDTKYIFTPVAKVLYNITDIHKDISILRENMIKCSYSEALHQLKFICNRFKEVESHIEDIKYYESKENQQSK